MASVNKVILIGRLGRDPELRATGNGTSVATLNIATSEKFKKDGELQEKTEWHKVIVWGKQADNCKTYLAKGRDVFVEGKLQTRSWDDKDGSKRYSTEIIAESVQFLTGKKDSSQPEAEPETSNQWSGSLDDIPF